MVRVEIDVSDVDAAFDRVIEIAHSELPWKSIGIDAEISIDQNFVQGGRYQDKNNPIGGNEKWTPRKKEYPHPILDDTMVLRKSISSEPRADGVDVISKGLPYNAAQNFGYEFENRSLPARPFMTIHPDDLEKVEQDIGDEIARAFE